MNTIIRFEPFLDGYLIMDNGEIFLIKEKDIKEVVKDLPNPVIIKNRQHPQNAYSIPTKVQIQVTPFCDLACTTCGVPTLKGKKDKPMTIDYLKELLVKLCNLGVLSIEWSGGEPLIKKGFLDLVAFANQLGFSQNLLTNGLNINASIVDKLNKYFHSIQISMDGVEGSYNKIVGRMVWSKLLASFKTLSPELLEKITIATVLQTRNVQKIPKILLFCALYNFKKLRISLQVPIGRSEKISWEEYSKVIDTFRMYWSVLKNYANDLGVKVNCFLDKPISDSASSANLHSLISPGGFSFLYIDAYGGIYPFPFLSSSEFYLGSVYKDSIKEIWYKSEILNNLRSISYSSFGCGNCAAECSFTERSFVYGFNDGNIYGPPLPNKECLLQIFK